MMYESDTNDRAVSNPPPRVANFLLAQFAVVSRLTGNVSLTEILEGFNVTAFPTLLSFTIFAQFEPYDSSAATVSCSLVDPRGVTLIKTPVVTMPIARRDARIATLLQIGQVSCTVAGRYDVNLFFNDTHVATQPLQLNLIAALPAERY